jgi:hypothetical protein
MNQIPMDFGSNFGPGLTDFSNANFGVVDDEIINYGEFLNDSDALTMELGMWEDLGGTEA